MNISTTISGGNILLNRLYGLVDSFNKEGLKNIAYMSAGVSSWFIRGSGGGGGGTWYGLLPHRQPSSTSPASRLGTQSQDKTSLAGPGALALCCPPRRPLVKVGPSFHLIWDTALCSTRSHALYLHHTMLRRWFMEFLFIYAIIFHGIKYLFRLFNTRNIKMWR